MQDPKRSRTRKPWYQRAIEMTTLWKIMVKSPTTTNSAVWKTIKTTDQIQQTTNNNTKQKLRKCSSLKVATSFTRVCLCAPISSYNEVFTADVPPRRSYTYPRSKPFAPPPQPPPPPVTQEWRIPSGRHSVEGRRVFRGKSLTDDVLMRRFVIEEEAMMQVRRRNEMEIIRKRAAFRRKKLGPSPLCRMVLAEEDDNA
ncbi:uncharacterized protein LOC130805184 [Amaranthus tricolor]|uniref:uncharacterized protein LOC130805184 n=1 Tax=Amaranthus tricolor TaxID=29722 RepID=UPI00258800D3|nr:uncharacterized protein LOC130805184 [Amaranthus tricolor]